MIDLSMLRMSDLRINKYHGIIISDTFNNPVFPIDIPKFDESSFYYSEYMIKFIKNYSKKDVNILPWHFFIEYVNDKYMIYVTRPYNYMFPFSSLECIDYINENKLNSDTSIFKELEMRDYIHVIILGDSTSDVYTSDIYYKIGNFIISAYKRMFYSPHLKLNDGLHLMSVGSFFNPGMLIKYM